MKPTAKGFGLENSQNYSSEMSVYENESDSVCFGMAVFRIDECIVMLDWMARLVNLMEKTAKIAYSVHIYRERERNTHTLIKMI